MKLFKTPTRNPEIYDADKDTLKQRIKELEEVVERYRTKRVGPYKLTITISGPQWNGITNYIKYMAQIAEKHGPDMMICGGGDSDGYSYSSNVESNTSGGLGENDTDLQSSNKSEDGECE